jgi:predicted nucleic acid-binding protein
MINILIDSDVILDSLLNRQPFSNDSSKVLTLCESKNYQGYVTGLIIANIYYLLKKEHNSQRILDAIKQLLTFLDVLVIDKNVILQSIDSDFGDFEDALQNYSAENYASISMIITRNVKDYKKSRLSVVTPEMFLKTL